MQWTLHGTIGSQLGDVQSMISVEGQTMTVADYIGGVYGFRYDSLWYCAVVLLGFCIVFWLVIASECPVFFVQLSSSCLLHAVAVLSE